MKTLLKHQKLIGGNSHFLVTISVMLMMLISLPSCSMLGILPIVSNESINTASGCVKIVADVWFNTDVRIYFCIEGDGYTIAQDAPEMIVKGCKGAASKYYQVEHNTVPRYSGNEKEVEKLYDTMVTTYFQIDKKTKDVNTEHELLIPPCDFLLCKGERVIKDTIRIALP